MERVFLKDLISVKEAAEYSGLSERHLRFLLMQGRIKGKKVGHDWITTAAFVDAYLVVERRTGPKPRKP